MKLNEYINLTSKGQELKGKIKSAFRITVGICITAFLGIATGVLIVSKSTGKTRI